MKALLVKTSSIGDLLHTLPAVTDAQRARPDLRFDWVVEEGLRAVPGWHPAVERVITVAYRKWRFRPLKGLFGGPLAAFRQELRRETYDRVIDAQGLYKSAVITRLTLGERHGLDLASCREKLAPLAYQRRHAVPRRQHAVQRLRALFALALDYPLPATPPDYGIDRARLPPPPLPGRYLAFLHGTAWTSKLWPESHWRGLAALAGWVTANPDWMALPTSAWLGVGAVTLITIGFYPLTQIYQIEEDLARGDLTFAAWVGPRRVFIFAVVVQGLASVVLIFVINQLLGPLNALVVALFYGVLLAAIIQWALGFDPTRILANYHRITLIHRLTSLGFLGFLSAHIFL